MFRTAMLVLALVACVAHVATAQETTAGSIGGQIVDAQGLVLPGTSAMVDVTNSSVSTNIGSDAIAALPVQRQLGDTLYLAPGVSSGGGRGGSDPSIGGASGLENHQDRRAIRVLIERRVKKRGCFMKAAPTRTHAIVVDSKGD